MVTLHFKRRVKGIIFMVKINATVFMDYILIVNIIPAALLHQYLDNPQAAAAEGNIFTKYSNSSNDIEEFDNNELPKLTSTKYSNSSDDIEEFHNKEMPELKSAFEIDEIESDE
ncbi:hypothetical protein BD410DRAFT_799574 [Rickenella mellea]|uniref:Uncharacterized protein n=1 Tax=Rickenella mellea TaxID=50990 RepID=A0A4Y7QHQ4_9AGAM|nr:hypothetical protein BD410DRAFT_799574 [Rickenella mellea]